MTTLLNAPSWQDLHDIGRASLQSRRPSLIVREGDVTDAVLAGAASMANVVIGQAARKFRSVLVLGADGDDLTVVAHDRGVDRELASAAVGTVTFARPAIGGSGSIPAGTRVATVADDVTGAFATFTTNATVNFLAADLTKSVAVTCTVTGIIGNVGIGDVSRILDTVFDSTIQVTNSAVFAGGEEEEEDPALVQRTRAFPLVLRRGTRDALEYAALLTPGVRRASVSVAAGIVTVYVSDSSGNSNSALAAAAQAIIDGPPAWRAAGDSVTVVAASLFSQDVDMTITVRAGVDVAALVDRIEAAVGAEMARLQPGDTFYRSTVEAAARAVDTQSILRARVNSPAADITPTADQIIRLGIFTTS